jgi:hypothetical protein
VLGELSIRHDISHRADRERDRLGFHSAWDFLLAMKSALFHGAVAALFVLTKMSIP